jgi:hypothetical protein
MVGRAVELPRRTVLRDCILFKRNLRNEAGCGTKLVDTDPSTLFLSRFNLSLLMRGSFFLNAAILLHPSIPTLLKCCGRCGNLRLGIRRILALLWTVFRWYSRYACNTEYSDKGM